MLFFLRPSIKGLENQSLATGLRTRESALASVLRPDGLRYYGMGILQVADLMSPIRIIALPCGGVVLSEGNGVHVSRPLSLAGWLWVCLRRLLVQGREGGLFEGQRCMTIAFFRFVGFAKQPGATNQDAIPLMI